MAKQALKIVGALLASATFLMSGVALGEPTYPVDQDIHPIPGFERPSVPISPQTSSPSTTPSVPTDMPCSKETFKLVQRLLAEKAKLQEEITNLKKENSRLITQSKISQLNVNECQSKLNKCLSKKP